MPFDDPFGSSDKILQGYEANLGALEKFCAEHQGFKGKLRPPTASIPHTFKEICGTAPNTEHPSLLDRAKGNVAIRKATLRDSIHTEGWYGS